MFVSKVKSSGHQGVSVEQVSFENENSLSEVVQQFKTLREVADEESSAIVVIRSTDHRGATALEPTLREVADLLIEVEADGTLIPASVGVIS